MFFLASIGRLRKDISVSVRIRKKYNEYSKIDKINDSAYSKIDAELRRNGKKVTSVASTGIASTLLRNGSTAHRQFFIPMNVDENKLSTVRGFLHLLFKSYIFNYSEFKMTMESSAAKWLRKTDLIIFDEATMADKWIYNCIDVLLQNIMDNQIPFGGKVLLLGMIFRKFKVFSVQN